jgi:hypothetical protein
MSHEEKEHRTPRQLVADKENREIAERIELGTAYHESVTVRWTDRQQHTVEVYALNTRQFRDAVKKSGLTSNQLEKLSKLAQKLSEQTKDKKTLEDVDLDRFDKLQDFLSEVAAAAVKDPPDILAMLAPGEDLKIGAKALEITNPPKT